MADQDTFETPRIKGAMDELMKSEEGRELASKLREQLTNLNNQFKNLKGEDKKKFLEEFREKMGDSFGTLKDTIKSKMASGDGEFKFGGEESSTPRSVVYDPSPNYWLFFIAFVAIIVVFG